MRSPPEALERGWHALKRLSKAAVGLLPGVTLLIRAALLHSAPPLRGAALGFTGRVRRPAVQAIGDARYKS